MLKIFFAILIALIITLNAQHISEFERIINGDKIQIKDYPFAVNLRFNGNKKCGGTLISDKCVLTAEHCVPYKRPIIACGGHEKYGKGQCQKAADIRHVGSKIDLAIVKLDKPLKGKNIKPAELEFNKVKVGAAGQVIGWGITPRYDNDILHSGNVTVKSINQKTMLLVKNKFGKQAPDSGDSGGPLIINGKVAGVFSGLANDGLTAAYIKLSYPVVTKFVKDYYNENCL